MNTLLVPVYWEDIEPQQGQFHFETVDGLIKQARQRDMHLIFLWFGLWKNAESMYVPGWMKEDSQTYWRAQSVTGEKLNSISPLCEAAVQRDAHAFTQLLAHIREIDEKQSTVLLIQVENEIGLLGTDRDYSERANALFKSQIPAELATALGLSGCWTDAFGDDAAEAFMAYHYASAVEQIARAGSAAYPLPLYANAWLKQYPWAAGTYPSGGPVPEVQHIWRAAAPTLCALAPDIYVAYVPRVIDEYAASSPDLPLIIPEVRKDATTASYALYAFAHHRALCYSPFGIEDITLPPESIAMPPASVMQELNIDPSAFDIRNSAQYLSQTYQLVESLKPLLLENRDTLQTFVKHHENDFGQFLHFSRLDATVSYAPRMESTPVASGGILELEENTFLLFGMMFSVKFHPKSGQNVKVDVLEYSEGSFVDGIWTKRRTLNGDEKMSISLPASPSCVMVKLYTY
ncbi:DUF5597 domain-containing protein [Alloscardovia macacae]|uniref:Beta-galactosidase n=1 Tax=Alloscardovia macacae TaxID=1160091 RepID=A0A261F048_9BIFI|nr:DUF5597 domain-containing protein [Alloscardovia macacae]OZG52489.1 beta-galactosidase [Alloscardovia macacae]